jgi:hypothetical protein
VKFKRRNLEALGELVCGNPGFPSPEPAQIPAYFPYRSSMYLTEFFQEPAQVIPPNIMTMINRLETRAAHTLDHRSDGFAHRGR